MRVLFVDPGKVTGWLILEWTDAGRLAEGGELPHDEFIDWAFNALLRPTGDDLRFDRVVCEGFTVTLRSTKETPTDAQLWSVKQIGVLETYCRWAGVPFERCMPADKAFAAGRDKLQRLGWWRAEAPGEAGHRRDAARHAIRWGVAHGVIKGEELA